MDKKILWSILYNIGERPMLRGSCIVTDSRVFEFNKDNELVNIKLKK